MNQKIITLKHTKKTDARNRILDAARQEFAQNGFGGARVEKIASKAAINKAMIFYYFQTKEKLYKEIIGLAFSQLMPQVQKALLNSADPEHFLDKIPRIYIEFFKNNPFLLKIVAHGLLQNPEAISSLIHDLMNMAPVSPQKLIQEIIRKWYEQGQISEPDPVHFVLNVIPLCLFSILGKPMVEAILDKKIVDNDEFLETRIHSISNLLKKGMLK
jgi:TetR/AcrR family transcriptional regulator